MMGNSTDLDSITTTRKDDVKRRTNRTRRRQDSNPALASKILLSFLLLMTISAFLILYSSSYSSHHQEDDTRAGRNGNHHESKVSVFDMIHEDNPTSNTIALVSDHSQTEKNGKNKKTVIVQHEKKNKEDSRGSSTKNTGNGVEKETTNHETKTSANDNTNIEDKKVNNVEDNKASNNNNNKKPNSQEQDKKGENKEDPDRKRMNIIVLYPDDWRHDSIGSEKQVIRTPFLNQLANEGIRFTQNAVTTSVCWMSRATLFTGQFSSRHQSIRPKCPHFVRDSSWEHSWPYILQKNDYFVGHVGKWQYVHRKPHRTQQLFNWTHLHEGEHWFGKTPAATYTKDKVLDFFKHRPRSKSFALTVAFYPPKAIGASMEPGAQLFPTNETMTFYKNLTLEEPEMKKSHSALPYFLQKNKTAATDRWAERYRTSQHYQEHMKRYYALVTGIDEACRQIVDKLKEDGLYNNTMIMFTTDNGMFHGAHGLAGKWYPYQESIRVPLIIYDPRMPKEKIGTLDDSFTLNIDLAETILGAAGIKADDRMQGRDISDLYLKDNKVNEHHATASTEVDPWRDEFFYEFPYDDKTYIASSSALVRKDWKYIFWPEYGQEQLFHLKNDPLELKDLINDPEYKSILSEMKKRHDELAQNIQKEPNEEKLECTNEGYW